MKIIDAQKLTQLKWLNVFEVHYIDRSNAQKTWQVVSRSVSPKCLTGKFDRPDAVIIVPFHLAKKKMVITREYRVPLADYEYGFPAGLVDNGESIQDTARRELFEETGLELIRIKNISPPLYSSAGMTDESVALVYVECEGQPTTQNNKGSEVIEILFVSPVEAARLCNDSALKFDAKAWLVISQFAGTLNPNSNATQHLPFSS